MLGNAIFQLQLTKVSILRLKSENLNDYSNEMNIFYTQRWPLHTIANVVLPPPGKLFGNWVDSRGWLRPNTSYNPYDLRNFLARPEEFFVETLYIRNDPALSKSEASGYTCTQMDVGEFFR